MNLIIDHHKGIGTAAHPRGERLGYFARTLIIHGDIRMTEPHPHAASARVEDVPPQRDEVPQCGGAASARRTGPVRMLLHDPVCRFHRHPGRHHGAITLQVSPFRKPRPRRCHRGRHRGSTPAIPNNTSSSVSDGNRCTTSLTGHCLRNDPSNTAQLRAASRASTATRVYTINEIRQSFVESPLTNDD